MERHNQWSLCAFGACIGAVVVALLVPATPALGQQLDPPSTVVTLEPGVMGSLPLPEGSSVESLGPAVALVEGAEPDDFAGVPGVLSAEPDGVVRTAELLPIDLPLGLELPIGLPLEFNDRLWHLFNFGQDGGRIDADIDWPEAMKLPDVRDARYRGAKASVATIDSGVDATHRELGERLCQNPGEVVRPGEPATAQPNGLDDDGNGIVDDVWGADFVGEDGIPEDRTGHGTQVAGLIAARQGASAGSDGVIGSAREACVMALRIFGTSSVATWSDMIEALHYAIDRHVGVINISAVGGLSYALERALDRAEAHSILIVAAAGNSGVNIDATPAGAFPAAYSSPAIVSVAASNRYDELAPWSNRGAERVDLAAPGVHVRSAKAGGGFASVSGTSFATPIVAGVASELLRRNAQLGPSAVRSLLTSSAEDGPGLAGTVGSGGRVHLPRALAAVRLDDRSTSRATRLRARASRRKPRRFTFSWRRHEPGQASLLVVNDRVEARIPAARRARAKVRVRSARATWWVISQDGAGNEVSSSHKKLRRRR